MEEGILTASRAISTDQNHPTVLVSQRRARRTHVPAIGQFHCRALLRVGHAIIEARVIIVEERRPVLGNDKLPRAQSLVSDDTVWFA